MATTALLRVDPPAYQRLTAELVKRPAALSVSRRDSVFDLFRKQRAEQMRVMTLTLTLFAVIVAAGFLAWFVTVALVLAIAV